MNRLLTILLVITVGISLISCGSGRIGGAVKGDSIKTEGWIDDDTYRIAAAGVPTQTLENVVQRKESSKRAAMLNAQYQILEKFKGSQVEGAAGMSNFETTGMAVAQEVKGIVKGGSVEKVTWDQEQNCEIIYQVRAKDLKKKVSMAKWE